MSRLLIEMPEFCDVRVTVHSPDDSPAIVLIDDRSSSAIVLTYYELCHIKNEIDKHWFDGKPPAI